MSHTSSYTPPKVWTWNKPNDGQFASINRPIAGPTHEKELPIGKHPTPTLFARQPERSKNYDHAGGASRARAQRRGIRCLADQDR